MHGTLTIFAAAFCLAGVLASTTARAEEPQRSENRITLMANFAKECFDAAETGSGDTDSCDKALLTSLSDHDRAATFGNRAVVRMRANEFVLAMADCQEGLRIDPMQGDIYLDRGAAYLSQNHTTEALADFNKAIELGVRKPHFAYFDRALAEEDVGDLKAAYLDYQKAVELKPDFTVASDQLKRFKLTPAPSKVS